MYPFTVIIAPGLLCSRGRRHASEHGSAVYLIQNGKAVLKPVETGRREGGRVEIISGWKMGISWLDPYNDNVEKNGRVKAVLKRIMGSALYNGLKT